jgi:hypothetical protein
MLDSAARPSRFLKSLSFPHSEANMIRHRRGLLRLGASCILISFVAVYIVCHLPKDAYTVVSTPSSPTHAAKTAPTPSEALRTPSKFESYGLGSSECSAEFGSLFKEIERAAAYRKSIGDVTKSDVNLEWIKDGAVRAMIYRQKVRARIPPSTKPRLISPQLFILEAKLVNGYHPPRAMAILQQIDRAVTSSPEPIPDIEFSFVIEDRPIERTKGKPVKSKIAKGKALEDMDDPEVEHENHTTWGLTRLPIDKQVWIMPDFGYFSWPLDLVGAYEQIRVEMIQNQISWEDKEQKLLWRGVLWTNKIRKIMYQVTRNKPWADVEEIMWKDRDQVSSKFSALTIPTSDHCAYQYLMHTEGRSYSGRGKYLLNCGSVVFTHKSEWIEPYHDVLVKSGPEQNIVEVERDFSDLERKVKQLLKDPERGKMIAVNGQKTFRDRYLTPAAQACYWRKLFQAWAEVSFRPEPFEFVGVDKKQRLRGVPFETFV